MCGSYTAEDTDLYATLAYHFLSAGAERRALKYLVRAGYAAFNRYANLEAADFYARTLAIVTEPVAAAAIDPQVLRHLFLRHERIGACAFGSLTSWYLTY